MTDTQPSKSDQEEYCYLWEETPAAVLITLYIIKNLFSWYKKSPKSTNPKWL